MLRLAHLIAEELLRFCLGPSQKSPCEQKFSTFFLLLLPHNIYLGSQEGSSLSSPAAVLAFNQLLGGAKVKTFTFFLDWWLPGFPSFFVSCLQSRMCAFGSTERYRGLWRPMQQRLRSLKQTSTKELKKTAKANQETAFIKFFLVCSGKV